VKSDREKRFVAMRVRRAKGSDRLASRGGEATPRRRVLLTPLTRTPGTKSNCSVPQSLRTRVLVGKSSRLHTTGGVCNFQSGKEEFESATADYPACRNTDP